MTNKENMMIEDFFKQAAQQQIEDNGFTERVMKNLPDRKLDVARRLSQLFTVVDVVLLGGGWCAVLRIWRLAGGDWSLLCQSSCDAWLVGSADGDGSYR